MRKPPAAARLSDPTAHTSLSPRSHLRQNNYRRDSLNQINGQIPMPQNLTQIPGQPAPLQITSTGMLALEVYFPNSPEKRTKDNTAAMSWWRNGFLASELSKPTSIFGLKLWILAVAGVVIIVLLLLALFSVCLASRSRRRSPATRKPQKSLKLHLRDPTPPISKEIVEIASHRAPPAADAIQIDIGGKAEPGIVLFSDRHRPVSTASGESGGGGSSGGIGSGPPEVSHLGWGRWYTLRELEEATGGLAEENIIGEGGYGIVYRGVLHDNTMVAVKNLLNNRGQAEKEFRVEVEAIGRVRHKNLVRLLGYCVEGSYRMLVYEYVDNGNLDMWLHGDMGEVNPLSWEVRMNIILGTAKGLAYLHEGLEPKVVHRDVKSSNILLDQHWHPKVSDFGLAKLLWSERSYVTTRVMGTFGYVAPEYASTGMLNERSDVYSFGVLIMEIITGRTPVDYTRPPGEVNLVDWLKTMVGDRKSEELVDPKIPEKPSSKVLKRALLVALRCVDPDAQKRPKMGHVIHMLEADDLLSRDDRKVARDAPGSQHENGLDEPDKPASNSVKVSEQGTSNRQQSRGQWR